MNFSSEIFAGAASIAALISGGTFGGIKIRVLPDTPSSSPTAVKRQKVGMSTSKTSQRKQAASGTDGSEFPDLAPHIAVQALAGEIVKALLADEKDCGYDLEAGLFGPAFSALVRRWANAESLLQLPHRCAAPPGWKLVPVEPTPEMWERLHKLDDEMCAGSYSGRGCTFAQAWDCLLDAVPHPPTTEQPWDEEAMRTLVGMSMSSGKLEAC